MILQASAATVVLVDPKYPHNVGGAIRACACWGVQNLRWTGSRVVTDRADTYRLPREERLKGYRSVDWARIPDGQRVLDLIPRGTPVMVEIRKGAESLTYFEHPDDAIYLFGPEDGSLGSMWAGLSHKFVTIPSHHCLNLAAAVNVVLYDRRVKRQLKGLDPVYPLEEILHEHRGPVWAQEEGEA